jgi:DNA gyrase subunit B
MDKEIGNQRLVLAMSFGTKSTTDFYSFCNYSPIEAGTPISAIKSCITRTLNKWGQENKLLKEKETLPGSALQEGISVVFNLISPNIRYDSQTKVRVTSTEDNSFINSVLSEEFELWLDQNPKFGESIIESALIARKAAEAAKKARAAVKNKAAEKKEKAFKMPTKLTDCWTKDRSKCELFLAEGLSAASGLVEARSSEFQAIYGLRGKCLSVLKTTPEKILANQEINNLIQALGLDCDTKTAKLTYDKDKLRYGKIIASADADFDGYAIENLIFNILWYLCPELIINGHVYSAVPPLFRVTTKKNEYIYLRDANALEDYKKEHANEIAVIGRMKGLGEQDSDELSYALLDPETRHIVQLKVTDFEKTDALFEDLYGKKVEPRVKFLLEHGEEANVD